jgi:dihydropteroate synthase
MEDKIPVAKFFFAPTFAGIFFKKHGAKDANKIIVKKMFSFIETAQNWISIEELASFDELKKMYLKILKGEVDPKKGYLIKG